MFKKILFLCLSTLCFNDLFLSSLQAYLISIDLLKDPSTGHYVYLLGDRHNKNKQDKALWDRQKECLETSFLTFNTFKIPATILIEGDNRHYTDPYCKRTWKIYRGYDVCFKDTTSMVEGLDSIELINTSRLLVLNKYNMFSEIHSLVNKSINDSSKKIILSKLYPNFWIRKKISNYIRKI